MKTNLILLDIETQRDFFTPGGSLYTKDSSSVAHNVYKLFRWAADCRIPIISTVLRLRPSQRGNLSELPYCVEGSNGEHKLSRTVLANRINLGLRNCTDLPDNLLTNYRQVIFEKRVTSIFAHARAERLISHIRIATFVIMGAGVAQGIMEAALGLRNRGFGVIGASDAMLDLNHPLADMARRRMEAKGVLFLPTNKLTVRRDRHGAVRHHRSGTAVGGRAK